MEKTALRDFAGALVKAGLYEQAQELAKTIEGDILRVEALCDVASALATAGLNEQAVAVLHEAGRVPSSEGIGRRRTQGLSVVASQLFLLGQHERAQSLFSYIEHVAETAQNTNRQIEFLCVLASGLARAGKIQQAQGIFERAEKIIVTILDPADSSEAISDLIGALVRNNQSERACNLLFTIMNDYWWLVAVCDLAIELRANSHIDLLRQVVENLHNSSHHTHLTMLTYILCDIGWFALSSHLLDSMYLSDYLRYLCYWYTGLRIISSQPNIVYSNILRSATEIIAWEHPDWREMLPSLQKFS